MKYQFYFCRRLKCTRRHLKDYVQKTNADVNSRWALLGDLQVPEDLICPEELANKHPGLRQAYNNLIDSITDNLTLDHWKSVIRAAFNTDEVEVGESDTDDDSDIQRAIKVSIAEHAKTKRPLSPGLSDIPTSSLKKQRRISDVPTNALPIRTRNCPSYIPSSSSSHHSISQLQPSFHTAVTGFDDPDSLQDNGGQLGRSAIDADRKLQNLENSSSSVTKDGRQESSPSSSGSPGTSNSSLRINDAQITEEDIFSDKNWVTWSIGPNGEHFVMPMSALAGRPHLCSRDVLVPDGKGGYTLTKPSFAEIDPVEFRPVAEYLLTGDIHPPLHDSTNKLFEEDDRKSLVIETYAAVWKVAEHLALHDLMEKIVGKMKEIQPWPLLEMLAFAAVVYSSPSLPMEADQEMRDMISLFIATHKKDYEQDYRNVFKDIFDNFHELRQHIYEHLAKEAKIACQQN